MLPALCFSSLPGVAAAAVCPAPFPQPAAPSCPRAACLAGEPCLFQVGGKELRDHPLPLHPKGWGVLGLGGITFFLVNPSTVFVSEVRLQALQG